MEYCDRIGISDLDQREDMEHFVRQMDAAYQDWAAAKT